MQLMQRIVGVVRRNPSKVLAAFYAFNLVVNSIATAAGMLRPGRADTVVPTFVLLGLVWALGGYIVYRLWFAPTRRFLVVLLALDVASSALSWMRFGIGTYSWRAWLSTLVELGLLYLAFFEPRVVARSDGGAHGDHGMTTMVPEQERTAGGRDAVDESHGSMPMEEPVDTYLERTRDG
jgi:hypothetical protein